MMSITFALVIFILVFTILSGLGVSVFKRRRILLDKKSADFCYGIAAEELPGCQGKEEGCYSEDNDIDIFITGKDKYRQLFRDIENARESIHLLYFIIRNDRIGRTIIDILARKARQGVKVRVLYDYAGCFTTSGNTFKPLRESGAAVESFFPLRFGNYLRLNYRNHRKIVIIDDEIGYLGGMNIGDEYMGYQTSGVPWRDTHVRMTGACVQFLQARFIKDWRFATHYRREDFGKKGAFIGKERGQKAGGTKIRIVSGGPDTPHEEIKWRFLKMVYAAKEKLYIQTPYFVPDESFMEALKVAVFSGVEVAVMVPSKSDNFIAQRVSLSYLGILLRYGVKVYLYPGFLHAKMILADDAVVSLGSTNMDMRSFYLNFEINAFLYGPEITKRCSDIFRRDLAECDMMEGGEYSRRPYLTKLEESFYRLFAPLL